VCVVTDYTQSREVEVCLECHATGGAGDGASVGAGAWPGGEKQEWSVDVQYQNTARALFGL
jgi:hypothetical protein